MDQKDCIPENPREPSEQEQLLSAKQGRWTDKEHQIFIQSIKKFGKDWKRIEEYIGTRSSAQIRSHAQKYANRLEKVQNQRIAYSNFKQQNGDKFILNVQYNQPQIEQNSQIPQQDEQAIGVDDQNQQIKINTLVQEYLNKQNTILEIMNDKTIVRDKLLASQVQVMREQELTLNSLKQLLGVPEINKSNQESQEEPSIKKKQKCSTINDNIHDKKEH